MGALVKTISRRGCSFRDGTRLRVGTQMVPRDVLEKAKADPDTACWFEGAGAFIACDLPVRVHLSRADVPSDEWSAEVEVDGSPVTLPANAVYLDESVDPPKRKGRR